MNLQGACVLITGASRGIGRGLAHGFARAGARVALVARSADALEELADELGGTAHPADLADARQVEHLIGRVEDEVGPVDVLVNNAGISRVAYVLDHTPADIDDVFAVNLLAPAKLCLQVVPRMLERGRGHIVNISSFAGSITTPGLVHYSASKAGLNHYTGTLRQDLRGLPIDLTLVELGSVPTEMDAASRDYPPLKQLVERSRGRDITPLDDVVAGVVDAVRKGKRHVRLPRVGAPLPALAEAPRRISEWLFRSVDPRPPRRD